MGRVATSAAWAGVGGVAWAANQAVEGRAFLRAAEIMNAQIALDYDAIGATGRLPEVAPVLPLHGGMVASKPKILLTCWAGGAALTLVLVAALFFLVSVTHLDKSTTPAGALVGSIGMGVGFAIFAGWFPGLLLWFVFGSRENARRSTNVVLQQYRRYWAAREQARVDLAHGADPDAVRRFLDSFEIATYDDASLFEGATA
ncbi:hypothetical protein [Luteococcus sanguinis]|uniref:Uncharacterized protein n=1 Tax=Luteococcus sanguinis TaxID=174038 RepID=A0ABW1X4D8_9ACTN